MAIPVFSTFIHPNAFNRVRQVLESTHVSEGKLVKEFESRLASELGLVNPVALNSGTSALCLSLRMAGVKAGDEVICPAQTFIATALSILEVGAVPVFADIQYTTGNIDPASIQQKISSKTKAIMVVHWGGYPCDLDEIHTIARNHNLVLIEDAAHALGADYKEKPIGSLSEYTCFSFQAIKHLTTGDGGAICCNQLQKAREAKTKRWFGIDRDAAKSDPPVVGGRSWNIEMPGYKYHMNDYSAALGLANLEGFRGRISKRREIASTYDAAFKNTEGITPFQYQPDRKSARWLYGMHVKARENFARAMKGRGVTVSVVDRRVDANKIFGAIRNDLVNQAAFDETQIHIPVHDQLTNENVDHIIESVKKGW